MKTLYNLGLLAAFLAVALGLSGCGSRSSKTRVAFVTNNPETFWDYAQAGCEAAGAEYNVDVEFRRPPNGSASDQKQIIDALLNTGVKALAISVIDPATQSDYLKNNVASRVPLLTQDNDAPDSGRKYYIGTDNYAAGKAVGELVKEAMPEGGTIAIFVGQMEALNAQQRRQGVLDALAGMKDATGNVFGKYKLYPSGAEHGAFTDNIDRSRAKDNATHVLNNNPKDENLCLIGLWAYNTPAIYAAVQNAKREGKVKIVGFDEEQETLDGIKAGHIYGTVVQQPYKFGYEAVRIMAILTGAAEGELPTNEIFYIPERVIKQDNVDAFREELTKLRRK